MTDEYQIDGTTHAEKNANGDIEHKPDVVNTDDLDISNISKGVTVIALDATEDADNSGGRILAQSTANVGTGGTTILDFDGVRYGGLVSVYGEDEDGNKRFSDLVHVAFDGSSVVNSITGGSPDGRSYSNPSGDGLTLTMAADSYQVEAIVPLARNDPT